MKGLEGGYKGEGMSDDHPTHLPLDLTSKNGVEVQFPEGTEIAYQNI
jgi:hypothetical protein